MKKNLSRFNIVMKLVFCLMIVFALTMSVNINHIIAGAVPSTSILDVTEDSTVTIRTYDFPADQDFVVTMGKFGTRGVAGYIVTTVNSGTGGSFDLTFNIPAVLYDLDKIAIRLESAQGYYAYDWFYNTDGNVAPAVVTPTVVPLGAIPTTSIKSVTAGVSVTIMTYDFPPDQTFAVTIGEFGTRGVGGTWVADTYSGTGGSFEETYSIPAGLADREKLSIRLESPEGFYAYDWFNNQTVIPDPNAGYTGIPTTSIKSVDPGVSVTVTTYNFPKDVDFDITVGAFGTRGIGGTYIKTINSAAGGSFDVDIAIPAAFAADHKLSVRFQSSGPYYAYDWFINQPSAVTPSDPNIGYVGIPTTSIKSVDPGVSVTVTTYNYPVGVDFKITMGAFGTRGIGGTYIKTINSAGGGSFDVECEIPASLSAYDKIAIRLESSDGVFYSYDWFNN